MKKEKDSLTNIVQKLDEHDLDTVNGGSKVKDISTFFLRNRLSTTCNYCGHQRKLWLTIKHIGKWSKFGGGEWTGAARGADVKWTCKNCGQTNYTIVTQHKILPLFYSSWEGHTFTDILD